ncbi:neuromedin-U isoform X1 [Phyllopteryx taeniolatus]|uniref:neuromedin-U isoform X1 n=1 Tax=Phyllopteryx taeniolatus TaxID=161469 RepID=UPI002AD4C092|nr:neuromedin-U isoform X1 [Phyllopteryx taeniolatus]
MPTKQQRAASSSSSSSSSTKLSRGSVSSLRAAAVSLAAILVLAAVPLTHSAPVKPWQTTEDRRQLLSQIDTACSSFFSTSVHFQASDVLGEICFLMLVQKSKELKGQENNKKSVALQPLLRLVSHLYTRRERGISVQAELEGPGGIQSRGYFLYRPRNGRRALEYE